MPTPDSEAIEERAAKAARFNEFVEEFDLFRALDDVESAFVDYMINLMPHQHKERLHAAAWTKAARKFRAALEKRVVEGQISNKRLIHATRRGE